MAHEIEDFLLDKFINGVAKSRVHKGKLKKLKKTLESLKESTKFEIRGDLYYLNNLLDECLRLSIKFPLSIIIHPHNVQYFREVGNNLEEVQRKLEEEYGDILSPQGSHQNPSHNVPEVSPPPAITTPPASVQPGTVHGFDEELIAVERLLLPRPGSNEVRKFKAVGITGVAGVGKTTLCRELLKRKGIRDHFIPRICVQLSERDEKEDVLKKILYSLGVEKETVEKILNEHKSEGLVCALYAQLMGKRYLIVLDNVCSNDDINRRKDDINWYGELDASFRRDHEWGERLAFGLPKGYGGTVIVTNRERRVVEKMIKEEENVHCLQPLVGPKSTWSIFVDAVGIDKEVLHPKDDDKEESSKNCADVKEEILKKIADVAEESLKNCADVKEEILKKIADVAKENLMKHEGVPEEISKKYADPEKILKEFLMECADVKGEILKKCAGVPLAAKMMGEIMKKLMEESQEQMELSIILRILCKGLLDQYLSAS